MPRGQQTAPVPDGQAGGEQRGAEDLLRAQAAELASLRALVAELPEDLDSLRADAEQWRAMAPKLPQLREQIEAGLAAERQALEQERAGVEQQRRRVLLEQAAIQGGVRQEWVDDLLPRLESMARIENGRAVITIDGEDYPAAMAIAGLPDRPEFAKFLFMYGPRMGAGSGNAASRSSSGRINPHAAEFQQLSAAQKLAAVFGTIPGRAN